MEETISENTINLVSNDAQAIEKMGYGIFVLSFVPVDIIASMVLVWYLVAWQALIGTSFFLLVVAYGSFAAHKAGKVRHQSAAVTDKRLEIMKEIITGIRVVKMYAWEWNFRDLVAQIRRLVSNILVSFQSFRLHARQWSFIIFDRRVNVAHLILLSLIQKKYSIWHSCYTENIRKPNILAFFTHNGLSAIKFYYRTVMQMLQSYWLSYQYSRSSAAERHY